MPINTMPYLALSYQVALEGIYPSQPGGGGSGEWYLGSIRTFAGNFAVRGHAFAQGQILSIAQNTALFSLYGTTYGGNGQTTFALPNFAGNVYRGVGQLPGGQNYNLGLQSGNDTASFLQLNLPGAAGGTSQALSNVETGLAARYCINVVGIPPSPNAGGGQVDILGAVTQFAGNFAPGGTVDCDGRLLQISTNQALFQLLGTTYGGDGITTFAVPDLRGRTPIGVGQGPGLSNVVLGQTGGSENIVLTNANLPVEMGGSGTPVDNRSPYLALTPLIAINGVFPSRDAPITNPEEGDTSPIEFQPDFSTIGEIIWFAGNFAPPGWAIAQGQILSIAQNTALFSILGTTYGGNGQTTFALPDLRGRAITSFGGNSNVDLGEQSGTETFTLTMNDIPSLSISGTGGNDTFYGGNRADLISGNDGNDRLNGNAGDDTLAGGADDDILVGGAGVDTTNGGAGSDNHFVDNANDIVLEAAGEGFDRVYAAVGYTLASGQEIEFLAAVDLAATTALTLTGNEIANDIYGNDGANTLNGGGGGDYLVGFGGEDILNGGADGDVLSGGAGSDQLNGDADNDYLLGGAGDDVLAGGAGNDQMIIEDAGDTVVEAVGGGFDRVIASISWTLGAGQEVEVLQFADLNATTPLSLAGNEFASDIYGNEGDNTLSGGGGDDYLVGGGGADALNGDAGEDLLVGGLGADILTGGADGDAFAFVNAPGGGNVDTIADFVAGSGDRILLSSAVFTGIGLGAVHASAFVMGTAAQDPNDRIIYDQTTGALYYDADGNGNGAQVQFATLLGSPTLIASDVQLI